MNKSPHEAGATKKCSARRWCGQKQRTTHTSPTTAERGPWSICSA